MPAVPGTSQYSRSGPEGGGRGQASAGRRLGQGWRTSSWGLDRNTADGPESPFARDNSPKPGDGDG